VDYHGHSYTKCTTLIRMLKTMQFFLLIQEFQLTSNNPPYFYCCLKKGSSYINLGVQKKEKKRGMYQISCFVYFMYVMVC